MYTVQNVNSDMIMYLITHAIFSSFPDLYNVTPVQQGGMPKIPTLKLYNEPLSALP